MFCVDWDLRRFRVHNPTTRAVEIRRMAFETWNHQTSTWVESFEKSELAQCPFRLEPFTSRDFDLSTPQSLDLALQPGRLRVKTGSNKEHTKEFPHRKGTERVGS